MTYLALLLPHPQKNKLIEIQGNSYCEELYKQVKATFKPFYEWNDWIREQMEQTLANYKKKRGLRLLTLGKFGGMKLLKKVNKMSFYDNEKKMSNELETAKQTKLIK